MTLAKIKLLAKRYGATVEIDRSGNSVTLEVIAPDGKQWCEGGVLTIVDCVYKPWKNDYADVVSRMSYGLENSDYE